ncbi:hypothetical protein VFPFJ_11294 [Purpureocillium lilacinum]|uniref:Uncharacterized protein n=1 Tax=Purpureocillium lilacinum TaxID=33203 RepID=A0A179FF64_PURLI|nr:hypothetical protein VFPFJ_11294 [Purpureocillium lilacinum]OAQ63930.1 hypothetical protein VFPFJ_11294 [Purpureocillium lilacinum]
MATRGAAGWRRGEQRRVGQGRVIHHQVVARPAAARRDAYERPIHSPAMLMRPVVPALPGGPPREANSIRPSLRRSYPLGQADAAPLESIHGDCRGGSWSCARARCPSSRLSSAPLTRATVWDAVCCWSTEARQGAMGASCVGASVADRTRDAQITLTNTIRSMSARACKDLDSDLLARHDAARQRQRDVRRSSPARPPRKTSILGRRASCGRTSSAPLHKATNPSIHLPENAAKIQTQVMLPMVLFSYSPLLSQSFSRSLCLSLTGRRLTVAAAAATAGRLVYKARRRRISEVRTP